MWLLAALVAALSFPTTCAQVMDELKMRPPAYGEKARAELVWDMYLTQCEKEWAGKLDADDVEQLSKVIQGR